MAKPWEGERLQFFRTRQSEAAFESMRRGRGLPASGETSHPPTASRRAPPSLSERGIPIPYSPNRTTLARCPMVAATAGASATAAAVTAVPTVTEVPGIRRVR